MLPTEVNHGSQAAVQQTHQEQNKMLDPLIRALLHEDAMDIYVRVAVVPEIYQGPISGVAEKHIGARL